MQPPHPNSAQRILLSHSVGSIGFRLRRFGGIGGPLDVERELVRVVDDPELLEQVPDDVGRRRLALDVQHLHGIARKVERGQSSEKD